MIRSEVLGELKDRAAGLVALAELLASRRVGAKAIATALPSATEACAGVAIAAEKLAIDAIRAAGAEPEAAAEVRHIFDLAIACVRTVESEIAAVTEAEPPALD